jgi:hypothetical protein
MARLLWERVPGAVLLATCVAVDEGGRRWSFLHWKDHVSHAVTTLRWRNGEPGYEQTPWNAVPAALRPGIAAALAAPWLLTSAAGESYTEW